VAKHASHDPASRWAAIADHLDEVRLDDSARASIQDPQQVADRIDEREREPRRH